MAGPKGMQNNVLALACILEQRTSTSRGAAKAL